MSEEITKEIDLSGFDFDSIELNGVEYDTNGNPINPQQSDVAKVFQETEVPKAESTAVEAVELNKVTYPVRDVEEAQTREEAIRNVNAEIAVLEENIANTVARLNEIKAELEGSISDVDTKVTSLETSVGNIETNIETIEEDLDTVGTAVDTIETKIPSQASASNQLADKDFVNSSIATNTANFIGTFNTLQELEAQSATNNDYAFWKTTDSDNNIVYKRYKYVADDGTWQYEYDLNNSSFTAEQWASIQSGITSDLVSSYSSHIDNKSNPHGVTKAQVGLGNVNNTSDANKPVSTATQTALDGKIDVNGSNGTATGVSALLNKLSTGDSDPVDADYFISQYVNGGTTTTSFHRRPVSKLWNYIKSKADTVYALISHTHTKSQITDFPTSLPANGGTSTASGRLNNVNVAIQTGTSKQAKISLSTLMTWLITTKAYIPSGTACTRVIQTTWSYADNDILQLTIGSTNYELQLAGVVIEFMGNATNYNTGMFRLRIHSNPKDSFTASSGYTVFPVSHIAEYTCNGSSYTPIWKMVATNSDITAVTLNGTSKVGGSASFYAPTSAGTSGQYLKSSGSGAPTWVNAPTSPVTSVAGKTGAVTLTSSDVGLGSVANSTYAGGTAVTLNGTKAWSNTASFYAPTAGGVSGQLLMSAGQSAPTWSDAPSYSGICYSTRTTSAKTMDIKGFRLYKGVRVTVLFDAENAVASPTLNINGTGAKNIKIYSNGVKCSLTSTRGVYSINALKKVYRGSTYADLMWQAHTTLDLIYDDVDWVIVGNPVFLSTYYSNVPKGYVVYANGLIKQWDTVTSLEGKTLVSFDVKWTNANSFTAMTNYQSHIDDTGNAHTNYMAFERVSDSQIRIGSWSKDQHVAYIAIGY